MPRDADLEFIDPPVRQRQEDEVLIISDDEDVGNRPPLMRGRRPRPVSIDSSSSGSLAILDEADVPHPSRHHVPKRRKTERDELIIPERSWKEPLIGDENDHTRVNLSFNPNSSRANLLFNTGAPHVPFTALPLDRNGFVQGSIRDPFETLAPKMADNTGPWFYHPLLEVKMYRGPGYERFPVVLGTVKGHKGLCDKWEADKKQQYEEDQIYIAGLTGGGINPSNLTRTQTSARLEKECLREVQAVFPQIQQNFVLEKYREHSIATSDNDVIPSAAEIISEIAELGSYPKEETPELPDEDIVLPEDGCGITIPYKKDVPKDEAYLREALRILATEFKHVPTIAIHRVLQEKQSLFDAFTFFNRAEIAYFDAPRHQRPYKRSKQPRVILEKKYQPNFSEPRDSALYVNLVNEFQAAKQHDARELHRFRKEQDHEAAEAQNLLLHRLDGSLIECQTCFDDEIPINRAIMCEGDVGHFFCFGCVARLAESQISTMKHEMMCMDGSGCKAMLSAEEVGRALSTKVVDKLAFYEQQAEISAAGIEGLEQCPYCEFKAICDPVEEDVVFLCQNPDCGKNTCRKCKEASHLPKTCDEAKKDRGLSARHVVEEARSEAMMRKCPKCKAKIIKDHGCNKMVCSCGNMMCYVCQQDISGHAKDAGYQHFHKAGSTCPLYDKHGTERHDQDADAAEKAAIMKVKAQDGNEDLDDRELRIETGKDKPKKKQPIQPPLPIVADVQRRALIQQQVQHRRMQDEQLRHERVALEVQRLDNNVRDANLAARHVQDNVHHMMLGVPGVWVNAYRQDLPDFMNPYAHVQQPMPPMPPAPNRPEFIQEEEPWGLLFGAQNMLREPQIDPRVWERGGNRNTVQEDLDNLDFAEYVLRGNR